MTTNSVASRRLTEILLASATILFINWMQHFPPLVQSNIPYATTDVLVVFWWKGIGSGAHLIPYVQFAFGAYPVIIGFLVYVTSTLALMINSNPFVAVDYYVVFTDIVLAAFTLGTVYYVYRICEVVRKDTSRIWKAFLVTPTFLLYPLFNWDMIAIFFTVLAVWYTIHNHTRYAALSLGLGIATKLYPAMILPVVMAEEKTWKARLIVFGIAALVYGLLNAPLSLLNFATWSHSATSNVRQGLEITWLILFFNRFDKTAYFVGFGVMFYLVYKGLVETKRKKYLQASDRIFERCILMNLAWLIGAYIVPPQMALMLLPFYVLVPQIPLALIYLEGVFNVLIIPLYAYTVISLHMDARTAASPAQWSAAIRQLIWLIIFIYIIYPKQMTTIASRFLNALRQPKHPMKQARNRP
jgi:uncharacterized membrane protein